MAKIKNIEGLSVDEIKRELDNGGKFVIFQYCISIILMTFKRSSDIYFIKSEESTIKHSIGFTIITFLLGWWGIPWGPIYTISALINNIKGGKDVTQDIINALNSDNE